MIVLSLWGRIGLFLKALGRRSIGWAKASWRALPKWLVDSLAGTLAIAAAVSLVYINNQDRDVMPVREAIFRVLPYVFSLITFSCLSLVLWRQTKRLAQDHGLVELSAEADCRATEVDTLASTPKAQHLKEVMSWRGAIAAILAAGSAAFFAAVQKLQGEDTSNTGAVLTALVVQLLVFVPAFLVVLAVGLNFEAWRRSSVQKWVFVLVLIVYASAAYTTVVPASADPCRSFTLDKKMPQWFDEPSQVEGDPAVQLVDWNLKASGRFRPLDGWTYYAVVRDPSDQQYWIREELIPDSREEDLSEWRLVLIYATPRDEQQEVLTFVAVKDDSAAASLQPYWEQLRIWTQSLKDAKLLNAELADGIDGITEGPPIEQLFPNEDESFRLCPSPPVATPTDQAVKDTQVRQAYFEGTPVASPVAQEP